MTLQLRKYGIVYSTESGRICPECGFPTIDCTCSLPSPDRTMKRIVRVRREVKGRRGKIVTSINGLPLDDKKLDELASQLRKKCGAGGSVKEGIILIQGDHRKMIVSLLEQEGYSVKLAGG